MKSIAHFKSHRNCKRRNKGNFTLVSSSKNYIEKLNTYMYKD